MPPIVYERRHRTGCGSRGARTQPVAGNAVWFRHFNPLNEYAGFPPMGAARPTAAPGMEACASTASPRSGVHPQDLVF